jgi:hypothetical protein
MMRRLLVTVCAFFFCARGDSAYDQLTYYVSPTGSDSQAGTSLAQAWATVSHAAAQQNAGVIGPCSTVVVQPGTYADAIAIVNSTVVTSATTTTNPLPSSGTASCPINWVAGGTVNIDAADIATGLAWTPVSGSPGVYQATFTVHPEKLFVDDNNQDTPQLQPSGNVRGAYSATASYNEYDIQTNASGNPYMLSPNNFNVVNQGGGTTYPWTPVIFPSSIRDSYAFSPVNTGLQNVAANPGSWYITPNGSAWTVSVHLADGSSPAGHTIKATHRDYGLLLQSVDYVTFTGFTFEHAFKQCVYNVAAADSSLGGSYWTGEYNVVAYSQMFNCGNVGNISDIVNPTRPSRTNPLTGDMVVRTGGETGAHFLRHTYPFSMGNIFGTVDELYGSGSNYHAGLVGSGIDGGGAANVLFSYADTFTTVNSIGVIYATSGVTPVGNGGNLGGRIAYDVCTNTIQCAQIGSNGFRGDHNFFHDYKGQGFQIGGPQSTSTPALPFMLDHNVIANAGQAPYNAGFNAIDCNGATPGTMQVYEFNNTIFNTPDAGPTFEGGCDGSHFYNNIVSQNAIVTQTGTNVWYPGGGVYNGSSFMYFVAASHTATVDWHDNSFDSHCTGALTAGCSGWKFSNAASCATFAPFWPHTGAILCENNPPQFVNAAGGTATANNFSLQWTSPARGVGPVVTINGVSSTPDLGAVPYGSVFPFVAPPITGYQY